MNELRKTRPKPEPIPKPIEVKPEPPKEPVKAPPVPEPVKAPPKPEPVKKVQEIPAPKATVKPKKNVKKLWELDFSDEEKDKPIKFTPAPPPKPKAGYNQAPPDPYKVGEDFGDHELSLMLEDSKSNFY